MEQQNNYFIVLSGNRIALPVIRDLIFARQLAALVIPASCTAFAEELQPLLKDTSIPVLFVTRNNTAEKIEQAIRDYRPVTGLVFAFSYKIPAAIFTELPCGFYNIHPGPLPAYRGPDPVFRQIVNREPYAAVTIHQLDEGYDSGPIVLTDKLRLLPADTHGLLTQKLAVLAAGMVSTLIKLIAMGAVVPLRKQDPLKAVFYKKQQAADVTIQWKTMEAAAIVALINACNPWNRGAVTTLHQNVVRFLEAAVVDGPDNGLANPGTVLAADSKGIKVSTVDGKGLLLQTVSCEEGTFSAARFSGFGVLPGHCFV